MSTMRCAICGKLHDLSDMDPDQHREPPFLAHLANDIWGYPPTCGLSGSVYSDADHPFVVEQRTGVTESRVLEWLHPTLHESRCIGQRMRT